MTDAHRPDGSTTGAHARPDTDGPTSRPAGGTGTTPSPGGRSRLGGLWTVFVVAAVVLLLLLVFILENSQDVQISYFGVAGSLPLGVALLLSAIAGVLLVAVPGYARILQLRRSARRGSGRG
ncbi:putative integral membrane protein [Crossiella equi]|uniref:Integral membrane protein n=1 Tax=Crossiella equi TaxID=130796 RepID=A0ABS5AC56_9PSEU|nr:LapA family protein [Crossiella equi]MBP2474169.1 putative integral membrane protein [Crossiella equi]